MGASSSEPQGPDFAGGVPKAAVPDRGMLAAHVGATPVLLSRFGGELRAVSGACTHYGGPLAEGLVLGETVRCPWHHACFSLRTGEALAAPAFDRLDGWKVETAGEMVFIGQKLDVPAPKKTISGDRIPQRIVIVGGGGGRIRGR